MSENKMRFFSGFWGALISAVASVFLFSSIAAWGEKYTVGPQDKLRLRVMEWRASIDEIYTWQAINGTYVVGPNGTMSVPLLGEANVNNLSTGKIAELIGRKLQAKMNLATLPDVTVEIEEYRPFYVTGIVDKPGEYAYRPGMTVLQAMSLSGGVRRTQDYDMLRLQRERLNTDGEIDILRRELVSLKVQKIRVQGELSEVTEIKFPDRMVKNLWSLGHSDLLKTEKNNFHARKEAVELKVSSLRKQKALLSEQLEILSQKQKARKKEISIIKVNLDKKRRLARRQLASIDQRLRLEQIYARGVTDLLETKNDQLEIKRSLTSVSQELGGVFSQRKVDLIAERATIENSIKRTNARLRTAIIVNQQVLSNEGVFQSNTLTRNARKIYYKIIRVRKGISRRFLVSDSTPILPGDVILVDHEKGDLDQFQAIAKVQ